MSLQTVDVVHQLEEALQEVSARLKNLAAAIERGRDGDVWMTTPVAQERIEAIAALADYATGEESILAEWREQEEAS